MLNPNEKKAKLELGVALEKVGSWNEAYEFWAKCALLDPFEIVFRLRQASAALRMENPGLALAAVEQGRRLEPSEPYLQKLDGIHHKAINLRNSYLRIEGIQAYNQADYGAARTKFDALAKAVPNHPWAKSRAIEAAGFAPDFAFRLRNELPKVRSRIFLTGCGRSGTWLLTAMLSCIPEIRTPEKEEPLGAFLEKPNEAKIHLVKRQHNAYLFFDKVPSDIKIIHVVRHPLDVLISQHLKNKNHISLSRIESEHAMYFTHIRNRANTLTVRYEDMVEKPMSVQKKIENFLSEKAYRPFKEFYLEAGVRPEVSSAMHGLRPLDASKLHRWRQDPEMKSYLSELIKESNGTLASFSKTFGYNLEL